MLPIAAERRDSRQSRVRVGLVPSTPCCAKLFQSSTGIITYATYICVARVWCSCASGHQVTAQAAAAPVQYVNHLS